MTRISMVCALLASVAGVSAQAYATEPVATIVKIAAPTGIPDGVCVPPMTPELAAALGLWPEDKPQSRLALACADN